VGVFDRLFDDERLRQLLLCQAAHDRSPR
jgi:hypothetical protein